jgi:hypothetical protein
MHSQDLEFSILTPFFFGFQASMAKKTALRVKWADHFGGKISVAQEVEGEEVEKLASTEAPVSWTDRKKRDRMREKELLAKAK